MDCPLRILALLFLEGSGIPEELREREGFGEERKKPMLFRLSKILIKGLVCVLNMSQCRLSLVTN